MKCPDCGSPVSLDVGPDRPLSVGIEGAVVDAAEDERIDVHRQCWTCGWSEERRLHVEAVETTAGDDRVVERLTLVDEIVDELGSIDDVSTLEKLLVDVRRRRRSGDAGGSGSGAGAGEQ